MPIGLVAALLAVAAWSSALRDMAPGLPGIPAAATSAASAEPAQSADLRLYRSIVSRVGSGEDYYQAATTEQRARSFPLRPGIAVRPPTLAWLQAGLGRLGTIVAAMLLLGATAAAWWRKLGDEGATPFERRLATALIVVECSLLLNPDYQVLHELWAGVLIALAIGCHRPGRWWGALAIGGLALAIRELALPFVMLMAALALYRRDWRKLTGWSALVAAFFGLLAWLVSHVSSYILPTDITGPGWLALRGPPGWLGNLMLSSPLHLLPAAASSVVAVVALLGWAASRRAAATTVSLLLLGYGVAFMCAGREDNFYWGMIVTPLLFAGIAFVPGLSRPLWREAFGSAADDYHATWKRRSDAEG